MTRILVAFTLCLPLAAHAAAKMTAPSVVQAQKLTAARYPTAKVSVNADITASGQPLTRTKTIGGTLVQGRLVAVEPKSVNATPFIEYVTKAKTKGKTVFFGKYSGDL